MISILYEGLWTASFFLIFVFFVNTPKPGAFYTASAVPNPGAYAWRPRQHRAFDAVAWSGRRRTAVCFGSSVLEVFFSLEWGMFFSFL